MPTILDVYLEKHKQLVLIISGMSGSNKSGIAEEISKSLKCVHINQNKYLNSDFQETIEINNNKIKVWDSDDSIDWNGFNKAVDEQLVEHKIIVISGISFNKDKIKFKIDYHIHLKLSKQSLLEKRHEFILKHADNEKYKDMQNLDESTEKQLLNQVTYPYYLKVIEQSIINKFLNINEMQTTEIVREVFKNIIQYVEQSVYSKRNDIKLNENTKTYEYI